MAMQQYLDRYAESESACSLDAAGTYDHVLCIPAYAESPGFLDQLTANIRGSNALVILIVNAPADADPGALATTQALAGTLVKMYPAKSVIADDMVLLNGPGRLDLLLIQHCRPGRFLDKKGGVGLARKIACDIACKLVSKGQIASPWIYTTDADAVLPADYFDGVTGLDPNTVSAGLYPFLHTQNSNKDASLAQQLYDQSMAYYVAGLSYAGSAWAFHTIGSTLVINAAHYAQARGFPKRQAGEDFYLLNKLGKIGRIACLDTSPLTLESRLSDRVPFGTGPALQKILLLDDPARDFVFYHPACFVALKVWLELAESLWSGGIKALTVDDIDNVLGEKPGEFASVDTRVLYDCLQSLEVNDALDHAFSHSKSKAVFDRHLHNWFDAFRTLKFIHWLRDNHYPSLPLQVIQTDKTLPLAVDFSAYAPGPPAWILPPRISHPGRQQG